MKDKILNKIPDSYSPLMHMLIPSCIGSLIIIVSLCLITAFSYWMLLAIAITLFVSFGFEWYVHKNILHKPFWIFKVIYDKHLIHHIMYKDSNMAIKSNKELYFVLMPPYAIVSVVAIISPVIIGLGLLFGLNIALTVLSTMVFFFMSYEWLHYSYHLPADSFIGRMDLIQIMREHHRQHHNWNYVRYNYNVTVPVFDWIMGTKL